MDIEHTEDIEVRAFFTRVLNIHFLLKTTIKYFNQNNHFVTVLTHFTNNYLKLLLGGKNLFYNHFHSP